MASRSMKSIFNHKPLKNSYSEEDLYKWKKPVYVKDDLKQFNKLFKGGYSKNPKRQYCGSGGFGGGYAFTFPPKNQRVAFIMSYSNTMKSHNEFIKTYMPQLNKENVQEKPELFGMDEDEYDKYKVPLNFKCRISPENQNADLEELTKSFIKRLEAHTGYSLCWRGAIHNDTEHRHAHVVINGKDKNGKDVYFNRETIILMRQMCMNAATTMLGERTQAEIELGKKRELVADRWTQLDEKIDMFPDGIVPRSNIPPEMDTRLTHLAELKLCKINRDKNRYELSEKWKETLQLAGRYNTYLEEYLKGGDNLEFYSGGGVKGTVERVITIDKDEAWNDALIVSSGKKRIYVPVWQLQKENLGGKEVTIKSSGKHGTGTLARQIRDKDIFVRE